MPVPVVVPTCIWTHLTFATFFFDLRSVTYPKQECLRPCPKPGGCPFLANLRSLFIVPFTPTGMTKDKTPHRGIKSSELKIQMLALVPSKAVRLRMESMRVVKQCTKSSQKLDRFLVNMQVLSSLAKDIILLNPSF